MTPNWQAIGHAAVGIVLAGTQVVAMADPQPQVVNICHGVALMVVQLGVSLGVWQVSQLTAARRALKETPCRNCGKLPLEDAPVGALKGA